MAFIRELTLLGLALLTSACRGAAPTKTAPAATVENRRSEGELTTVKLTADAERRLGLSTVKIEPREVAGERSFGADVTAPPGRAITMAAPVAGTVQAPRGRAIPLPGERLARGQPILELVPMAPVERDLKAQAERQLTAAEARLHAVELQADRAEKLLEGKAGSARGAEDAAAQREQARAEVKAARERLDLVQSSPLASDVAITLRAPRAAIMRQLQVAPGQTIAAGAALFELVDPSHVWVRVPVFVDDLRSIDKAAPARLRALGAGPDGREQLARPIAAPPSADLAAATVDLYYELDNGADALRPGQRIGVSLKLVRDRTIAAVPLGAVVYDFEGGAWVYERLSSPLTYARRRVVVERAGDGWAALLRGPAAGTEVVSQGAAELFGVEFGAGH